MCGVDPSARGTGIVFVCRLLPTPFLRASTRAQHDGGWRYHRPKIFSLAVAVYFKHSAICGALRIHSSVCFYSHGATDQI